VILFHPCEREGKGKEKQGVYSAGHMRARSAPLNSARLTAFPSETGCKLFTSLTYYNFQNIF